MKANERGWNALYGLQAALAVLFLAFPLTNAAAATMFGGRRMILTVVYVGVWVLVGVRLAGWKCPRCTHPFLRKVEGGWTVPVRLRCANCGLKVGSRLGG